MQTLPFGTDGVRGVAHEELTTEFVRALGAVAAQVLGAGRFYIGRDTRESGPDFTQAFADGLASAGAEPVSLGVVPTPAVAGAAATDGRPAAMISASHNPWTDNGIKLFAAGGVKLSDAVQDEIADRLALIDSFPAPDSPAAIGNGRALVERYGQAVEASIEGRRLDGLSVVIDCANGSNSFVAETVLRELGADVTSLFHEPDGRNINVDCGSTYPGTLQHAVVERGADLGLAFDGDADRVLAVDHTGALVDGDHLIAICAIDRKARGRLADDRVVVTVMTNLGFRLGMQKHGITVVDTAVGDRYVLEALDRDQLNLGGEQSGHVIFRDLATTGDGLLTGVQVLDVVARSGQTLAALADAAMTQLPQTLVNVRVAERPDDIATLLADDVAVAEAELGATGRVLLRSSGTEPLVRVMVEAAEQATAERIANELAGAVTEKLA
ncbi:MAG: phosphoglucosamine mutase [Acidimicrobiales bacterium]|nr:phosphoglucosamine mutase [Acidimicrobiales bacterium]